MEIKIIDTDEKITCRICGSSMKNIAGKHIQVKHGVSCDEYKMMFPDAPTQSKNYIKKTSKNSGKHMKEEKYKKMFSEMFIGDKNPNHKSNTTEGERKSRSPFSKEFTNYKGVSDVEKVISNFAKEAIKNRITTNQKLYWINMGYSEDESIKLVSERQRTFSLEKCIEKYGQEDGKKRYTERQIIWQESLRKNGNIKNGFSKISQELFTILLTSYDIRQYKNIFYATKNGEYKIEKKNGGIFMYDFVDTKSKKIIEYNGDQYHANPSIYNESDRPHPFRDGFTSEEIWQKDAEKIKVANYSGFSVLVIWDSEYRKNKKETIDKCLNFLKK